MKPNTQPASGALFDVMAHIGNFGRAFRVQVFAPDQVAIELRDDVQIRPAGDDDPQPVGDMFHSGGSNPFLQKPCF
jgi:hypothetical protein